LKGGERIDEIKAKISSHTACRTFITRLLKKGLIPEQIMIITGDRNRRSFDEYVKITQSDAIDSVRNAME
jgi:predicted transcriptional regulator